MSAVAVGASIAGGAASALVGSAMGGGGGGGGSTDPSVADPFYTQRMGYQAQLQALMGYNGQDSTAALVNSPGYKFNMQQGLAAVQGSAASQGMLNSGNVLTALQTQGAGIASNQYWNTVNALSQMAGANIGNPGVAGQIQAGVAQQNQMAAGALGNVVGGAVQQGVNSYFQPQGYQYGSDPFASSSGFGVGGNTYGFSSGMSDPSYGVSYGFGV